MNQVEFQKYIGQKIRNLRENRNISQKDAALIWEFDIPNLSRLENGKTNITTYNLYKILKSFGITFQKFFEDYNDFINIDIILKNFNKDIFLYPNLPLNRDYYVYLIVLNKKIIYVGKSKDIHSRLKSNLRVSKGDSIYCISLESEEEMLNYEGALIQLMNPVLNKQREGLNSEEVNNLIENLKLLFNKTN